MKHFTLFYLPGCPFCKRAFAYIEELKAEHPEYQKIELETINENEHPEIADQYDYYYVPTFYIEGKKAHEGGIFKNEVEELLKQVIE